MSRKRKKGARKQLTQPRGQAPAGEGAEPDQIGGRAPASHSRDDVLDDALPLLRNARDASDAMDELMTAIVASADLADEPELAEIFIDPLLCAHTFAEVGEELGWNPESLNALPEDERVRIRLQIMGETIGRLLTDQPRQDILKGLNELRLRLKRSGKRKEAARAAALQSLLSGQVERATWSMTGLVQAIFGRSLTAGFELLEAGTQVMMPDDVEEEGVPWTDRVMQSGLAHTADALIRKIPGIGRFLARQADKVWDEGLAAVYTGELYLGLYTEEELIGALEVIAAAIDYDGVEQTTSETRPTSALPGEVQKTILSGLDGYVTELITPERLQQLRRRLAAILKDPEYRGRWVPYLVMVTGLMADQDAVENEKRFLISSLLGEMIVAGVASFEDDA